MFCTKMKTRIKSLLRNFDTYVEAHIDTALTITKSLKSLLSSPAAEILTAIIPGDVDNVIRLQLISALGKAIEALTIVDNCKQYSNLDEKLKCFVEQLQQRDPHLQDAILQKLASLLACHLDGQRLKQSLYDLYTQAKYSSSK